jgi:hypothetical protein
MTATQLGEALAKILPAVRTKLQLSGLAVIAVAWLLVHFAPPGRTDAMLTGGAVGVSMIIFAQLFHVLRDFPRSSRATVFLGAFGMFCFLVLALLLTTVVLLRQPSIDVTLEDQSNLNLHRDRSQTIVLSGRQYPRVWRTASDQELVPKIFGPDRDDTTMRNESEKFGTAVRYSQSDTNGVLEVSASMPYLSKMQGVDFIVGMGDDSFRWLPPVLSFKISNPRSEPLVLTRAIIDASSIVNEDQPILVAHDASPGRTLRSQDDTLYNILRFTNVSWGVARNPVLRFTIVRNADVETAAPGPFQNTITTGSFDDYFGVLDYDLTKFVDPKMPRERLNPLSISNTYDVVEYLNVIGQLAFQTERAEPRLLNFRVKMLFGGPQGGRISPSYKYNVGLPTNTRDFPITIPLSQCVRSADNFLIAFNSSKSARYDLNIQIKSTDNVVLTKHVILHTLVPRTYGLAYPERTASFSDKEGCT